MTHTYRDIDTLIVHAGDDAARLEGAVTPPIFPSSTYLYRGAKSHDDILYLRMSNTPTQRALQEKIAALEGAEAAYVTSSGMAAVSSALLSVLGLGDHLLVQRNLYGGTHELVTRGLEELGRSYTFVDADRPGEWEKNVTPKTRAFYVEAISNPLMEIPDLEAVVRFCKSRDLVSIVDATFATPVNFRPLQLGFDLVLHSATKYLNGHTDLVAGCVSGSRERIRKVGKMIKRFGGCLDPHACYLLQRGLRTLGVRVRHQNGSALALAHFLETHAAVERVNYPGLENHPHHARAKKLFAGFGGMLSFEIKGGVAETEAVLAALEIPLVAPSLGGIESLVTRPATTSHAQLSPDERRTTGISEKLVRVSVGIESPAELVEDFRRALTRVA